MFQIVLLTITLVVTATLLLTHQVLQKQITKNALAPLMKVMKMVLLTPKVVGTNLSSAQTM